MPKRTRKPTAALPKHTKAELAAFKDAATERRKTLDARKSRRKATTDAQER